MTWKGTSMKSWIAIKKWLGGGCVYFTVTALLILFFNFAALGTVKDAGNISMYSFLLMFPFGLCLSAAGMLLGAKGLSSWIRFLSHYLITVLAVFLFLILPSGASANSSFYLVMFALLSALYWILFGFVALIRNRVRRLMEED